MPWLVQLMKWLDASNPEHLMVITATMALAECYKCLSSSWVGPEGHLRHQGSIFGDQVSKLHALNADRYALLPKMHMFQELCSQGIRPSQFWLYREEDFGGSLASMSHRSGGAETALASSRTCLMRFCMTAPVPSMCVRRPGEPSSSVG